MKVNEIKEDAIKNMKFWKLEDGDELTGSFESDDFQKKESVMQDGKVIIKYENDFTVDVNGQYMTKSLGLSASTIESCAKKAERRSLAINEAIFTIARNGSGLATKYEVDCLGKKDEQVGRSPF